MKAIMVMFDTLNRHYLESYGCDWTHTPNFRRLADRCTTFTQNYIGSAPCMPARREIHTGRYNFLHRAWGPLEPFDDSMPRLLRNAGIHTHLTTDHVHYVEEGGGTYLPRYCTWELSRGQEGDPWIPQVGAVKDFRSFDRYFAQDIVNQQHIATEENYPQSVTFNRGLSFIERNHNADNWFLSIETFDPHEPFHAPERFKDLYREHYDGSWNPWPGEDMGEGAPLSDVKYPYAALVSMCDDKLGMVLDAMDTYNLWDDTMLIVNTDHGFLLHEHGQWSKSSHPFYREVCNTPLFIWDPRSRAVGENNCLVQTIDLAPTLLEYFHQPIPSDMQGIPLGETIRSHKPIREGALLGVHGQVITVTDGRYTYVRSPRLPAQGNLFNYTLMPTHMHDFFSPAELKQAELVPPLPFTKDLPVMKIPSNPSANICVLSEDMLFDIEADPSQDTTIQDVAQCKRMEEMLVGLMEQSQAPPEQFRRMGIQM